MLEHTYRRELPWGLAGGWLKRAETPEVGLAREVFEETGLHVSVDALLAADFWGDEQLDLLYRCTVLSGEYQAQRRDVGGPLGCAGRVARAVAKPGAAAAQGQRPLGA